MRMRFRQLQKIDKEKKKGKGNCYQEDPLYFLTVNYYSVYKPAIY